jgi:hypothetical protein
MQRVGVIGCGGAGETTVARALARRLDLRLVDADEIVHGRGARQEAEWRAARRHRRLRRRAATLVLPRPRAAAAPARPAEPRLPSPDLAFPRPPAPPHPRVLDRHRDSTHIVVLRSRADARRYLAAVAAKAGARPDCEKVTSPSRRMQRKPAPRDEALTVP